MMEWLKGMNQVMEYIEENLTGEIKHQSLARIVGCSEYEFSRIFSFMTGQSISEYIRRRRLSQSVFDIQNSEDKMIDIALKYGYESQASFSRAFKELQNQTPSVARKKGISLKTYPPLSFRLCILGGTEMNFRVEEKESFQIMGLAGNANLDSSTWGDDPLSALWRKFLEEYNSKLINDGDSYYSAPFWQVAAYDFDCCCQDSNCDGIIIGAEYKGVMPEGMTLKTIPKAKWIVFTMTSPTGAPYVPEAWARVTTEWLPNSQYKRDESVPSMEVFPDGDASSEDYQWEIWIPVLNK